jgi:hypothetical protein
MRSFAGWVTSRPHRSILLVIVFAQFIPLLAAALLVLEALRRGPRAAVLSGLLVGAGFLVVGVTLGATVMGVATVSLPLVLGAGSGALAAISRSLALAFQVTLIAFVAASLAVFGLVIDPHALGAALLAELTQTLELVGFTAAQIEPMRQIAAIDLTRGLLGTLLASTLAALLLGSWWHSLIAAERQFGAEFRRLKLGRVAAGLVLALVAAWLLVDVPAVELAAPVALIGGLFQGLSVLHARTHSEGWHRVVLVLVYLSLISPWADWAFLGVSTIGLLDNFFSLRAPIESRD